MKNSPFNPKSRFNWCDYTAGTDGVKWVSVGYGNQEEGYEFLLIGRQVGDVIGTWRGTLDTFSYRYIVPVEERSGRGRNIVFWVNGKGTVKLEDKQNNTFRTVERRVARKLLNWLNVDLIDAHDFLRLE